MKVKLQDKYKDFYTIRDLERAKEVIKYEKDDDYTAKDWAAFAVNEALKDKSDSLKEVLVASAYTAKNCRAFDNYFEKSEDMDVIIEATAETYHGFIKISAYLTDIWQAGAEDFRQHMYVQYFTEA